VTAALKFRQSNLPRQQGELARFKVIQGPDYGNVFIIGSNKVKIGRGDDNDIVLGDLKASRNHAELFYTPGGWELKDSGSANGILYDGKYVRSVLLKSGEVISIGETTLEFVTSQSGNTMILMAPPKTASVVRTEQANFIAKRAEVRALGKVGGNAPKAAPAPGARKPGSARSTVMILLAAGVFFVLFMGEESRPPLRPGGADKKPSAAVAMTAPPAAEAGSPIGKSAETFFRAGFREYTSGNYIRARMQFKTVLQISPGHKLASLYLDNCDRKIDEAVKFHLERGKRSREAGKLKEARGHYESVMRLLFQETEKPEYAEAKTGVELVVKEMQEVGGES
jgi:hypothetical protein